MIFMQTVRCPSCAVHFNMTVDIENGIPLPVSLDRTIKIEVTGPPLKGEIEVAGPPVEGKNTQVTSYMKFAVKCPQCEVWVPLVTPELLPNTSITIKSP